MRQRTLVSPGGLVAAVLAVALGTAAPAASAEPAPPAAAPVTPTAAPAPAPATRPPTGADVFVHTGPPVEDPDATRSPFATWIGLGLVGVGAAACVVSTTFAVEHRLGVDRGHDERGPLGLLALLVNWGAAGGLAVGLPIMMGGALRNEPRSASMALAGTAATTVGAASLVVGTGFLGFGADNPNLVAPGAALAAVGVAASAAGLGLYFGGNRRADGAGRAARPAWMPVAAGIAPAHAGVAATWQF